MIQSRSDLKWIRFKRCYFGSSADFPIVERVVRVQQLTLHVSISLRKKTKTTMKKRNKREMKNISSHTESKLEFLLLKYSGKNFDEN